VTALTCQDWWKKIGAVIILILRAYCGCGKRIYEPPKAHYMLNETRDAV
jgi:hypothetical protein